VGRGRSLRWDRKCGDHSIFRVVHYTIERERESFARSRRQTGIRKSSSIRVTHARPSSRSTTKGERSGRTSSRHGRTSLSTMTSRSCRDRAGADPRDIGKTRDITGAARVRSSSRRGAERPAWCREIERHVSFGAQSGGAGVMSEPRGRTSASTISLGKHVSCSQRRYPRGRTLRMVRSTRTDVLASRVWGREEYLVNEIRRLRIQGVRSTTSISRIMSAR